eukprot:TRINITY_DN10463_c0_g1_i1.p1 TRINITY_DN10463_c0_g1~~TRINITY_DN10463_c0_g1_i1.p1  ORF type:complete len:291 (+),score=72.91 TRINITY_DN10463_c0_g1_i1:132-1004(+)
MGFKEEGFISAFWPLARQAKDQKALNDPAAKLDDPFGDTSGQVDRAFDIADAMEMGLARELVTDFIIPLRRSNKLFKFKVNRSEDRLQYRLCGDDGSFLMYAKAKADVSRVDFYLYDPRDSDSLFDPARPAFCMKQTSSKTEWRIVQEGLDSQQNWGSYSPGSSPSVRSPSQGQKEVAVIRHSKKTIGHGVNYIMDVELPPLESAEDDTPMELVTKLPEWNEDIKSLVLDFKGRRVISSSKNFQLATTDKPGNVACQFVKLHTNSFGLDFRHPLTVIQAFGIAMTTINWT